MDETRAQAYLQLIHTLLNCPNGDEPQILQDNSELLDRGFLEACELVAENLTQQGGKNAANFLRNLVSHLAQFMDTNDDGDSDRSEGENPQEYAKFILELLQAEASNGDISYTKVTYPMLEGRQHLLDSRFAQSLQQVSQRLITENPKTIELIVALIENLSIHISEYPYGNRENNLEIAITGYQIVLSNREPGSQKFAQTQYNLANDYSNRIKGSRADNLERAIEFYDAALTVYTLEDFPKNWANTQNCLAAAYTNRINGSRAENVELAISCYQAALTVYTFDDFRETWANTQNSLAAAYTDKIKGSRAENVELAIEFYQAALTVYTFDDFPKKWAMTQNNLANAYKDRISGLRAKNMEQAIGFCQAALRVFTFEGFPKEWANTQNTLAVAYTDRINGSEADNLELAIGFCQAALTVYTFEDFPKKWAMAQNNLAIAYKERTNGSRADNLELAISFFKAALTVYFEDFPQQSANTQNNLAIAYRDRIKGSRADNLEKAIEFYQAALTVYKLEDFPEKWATTQNNLAAAYSDRINGSRADNLEKAIEFFQAALTVLTLEDFPEKWATTQNNLAIAYSNRINGLRADNLEKAIGFYEAALTVRTLEDFPEDWAGTQNNLAIAYSNRINGSRADNLEKAIEFYQAALTVYKLEDFPEKWAMTQNNLANAYSDRINGSRADNLEKAIEFYQAALTVYKLEDFPEKWAMTQNNLANAYSDRINGSRADNLEKAIEFYQAALTVYKLEDFPEDWAGSQNNLANAYLYRINGSRADNLEKAIEFYQAALTIRTREAFPQNHAETLSNLGYLYRSNQQWQLAYDNYALAIETVEILRGEESGDENKQKLAEVWNRLYLGIVEVCIELQRYTEAVEYAERSKGQNLIELLSVKDLYPQGEIPPEVRQELQQLRLRIAEENQRLKQAEDKNYDAINQLRQDLAAKYPYTPLKFGEIQQLAGEKTAIVEWYILNNSFCAFIANDPPQPPLIRGEQEGSESPLKMGENQLELTQSSQSEPDRNSEPPLLMGEQEGTESALKMGENQLELTQLSHSEPDRNSEPPLLMGEQEGSESPLKMGENQLELTQLSHSEPDRNSEPPLLRGAGGIGFWQSSPQDLEKLIDWVREYLQDYYSNPEQWQNSLGTKLVNLAQILHIDQILAAIPETYDKLILIPHRYLHLFPIHALPVSGEIWQRFHRDNENCPLNPCLVDCFDNGVSYAPSCQILHQVQKYKRGKFDKLFAIQNPTDDLMAADMEVETIKNIFPNPEIVAKENGKKGAKSEETLEIAERVADSHHLFFSCHGYFNSNDPLQSGLELADGTLTLEEIIRYFNLSECSLVTLSACETGQVQLDNTDEYISLTSGFLLAGSPSLYVTLWSVNAFSTAILLIKTYENLYQQPGQLALALNQAQIWVRDTDIQGFLDWTNQCHLLDKKWREKLQRNLNKQSRTQGDRAKIYQNPYHWAGFCAAGKGEQNMTQSTSKLEIFQQLIQESDLFVNLRDALDSLKEQLTDNDITNIKIIDNWIEQLPEPDKNNILEEYEDRQLEGVKLGNRAQSPTKPGQASQILKEIINLTIAPEKPPESNQDTP
ncbi:tetratricopeptide repeat protein [Microcoleus sp. A2-D2]|uniref:CHAT domain-containing protein n=1 Tax=Microcoleus sp. A2-D2 TaxID=2818536 RepID=UPI002FD5F8DF